jgi:muconate cycloisomerase
VPSLKIAQIARDRELGFQIGCQVGETGILSAAGRHLAALLPDAKHLEGSYDRFLLNANLTVGPVSFGYGGRARPLTGPGLGVEVSETALNRMTVSRTNVNA